jgi:hypothetical protein
VKDALSCSTLTTKMPSLFISYSRDNERHIQKTVRLSDKFREQGIDATVDAYEQHPAEGWPKWMEKQFSKDFIITVLSPRYVREFNQKNSSTSGARYEGAILSSLLFQRGVSFERIAVVCFDDWDDLEIPHILSGCTRYYVDRPGEYEKLYCFLTGQAVVQKPPLGQIIQLPTGSSLPQKSATSFPSLCKSLWPLMEENRRIFEDFGPNSGSGGPENKSVRFDLSLWRHLRTQIGENNAEIARCLRLHYGSVPEEHKKLFDRWLSHIEAFAIHLNDEAIDYREHLFPREVIAVVRGHL